MNSRRIPLITKLWLAVILVVALVPWLAIAQAASTSDEEFDQAGLDAELLEAAALCDLARVKRLLDKGADVTESDIKRGTALKIARQKGHTDIEALLKAHGAKE